MERIAITPRSDWRSKVESLGFGFHTADGISYWDESAYYRFTLDEIDTLERATIDLDRLCLEAVAYVIEANRLSEFGIPAEFHEFVAESWERDELTIVGRFDFSYGGCGGVPKLLEYNADTPTSLLEAAVVQWYWMRDVFGSNSGSLDQFNSIHERLIEAWKRVRDSDDSLIHFTCVPDSDEDATTIAYLRDTAAQAGIGSEFVALEEVGWNAATREFRDAADKPVQRLFKLYPWEMMLTDDFAPHLVSARTRFLEAPWKMILSSKALLPILWELYPDCDYLLEAGFLPLSGPHAMKPIHSREGANVSLHSATGHVIAATPGPYDAGNRVYQALAPLPDFGGRRPVIGSWMVNGHACGIGIRESDGPITTNLSRFVPHVFVT